MRKIFNLLPFAVYTKAIEQELELDYDSIVKAGAKCNVFGNTQNEFSVSQLLI